MLYRQELLSLCETHICLHVSLPTAPVHLPGEYTSISHRLVSFCIEHHRRTDTYQTDGLLSLLLPALREALLFEGTGQYAMPMLEPEARQQGLKAHLLPRKHLLLGQELEALPEHVVPVGNMP